MEQRSGDPSTEELLDVYRVMLLIRRMEERLGEVQKSGVLPGPVHLYIGQEAIAAGVCAHLEDDDWIASTHRGHGHFLAKGGDPDKMVAEVYGRATGICQGKGGSMHVADFSKGILGANGIVAGGIGLAAGAALAAQLDGKQRVSVAFFGDGAANQGVLSEALNLAALWKLPLILVCENNGFSEFSPTASVTSGNICDRAAPYGVPGIAVDGNDAVAMWQVAGQAIERARSGAGPTLIEAKTYRTRGHVEYESTFLTEAYRTDEELDGWLKKDPIPRLAQVLASRGVQSAALAEIDTRALAITDRAYDYADKSPWPEVASAYTDMLS